MMKRIAVAGALPEVVTRLKELAPELVCLLMAARKFLGKKIALATAMELRETAQKLEMARKEFCMIEITGDIDKDAEQLFLVRKITADEFRIAMRRAFKLDREATSEINNYKGNAPLPPQTSTTRINGDSKSRRPQRHGRKLTPKELKDNARKNELIKEIRRRAQVKYTLGADGIKAAYDEIDEESKMAGSKWHSTMPLATRTAIIDKAKHNRKYVTSQ